MTKKEFINMVADTQNITKADANKAFEIIINGFKEIFERKEEFNIKGFGKIGVRKTAERTYVIPKTGEKILKPKCLVPYFKISKILKDDNKE